MAFAKPLLLILLLIPLALLVLGWRRHGQPVPLPFDAGGSGKIRSGAVLRFFTNLAHSLPALLLAVAILLFAGPQQFSEPRSKRVLTNIEFAVDVSGSMTSEFGEGDRYDAAMASILEFIDYREGDAFGLTIFGDDFLHWVPLTSDPSAIRCAPPFLSPRVLPRWFGQGTSIGLAVEECLKVVTSREEGDRMIILVSDGYSSDLYGDNAGRIAQSLRDEKVVLFSVHIGEGGPPEEIYSLVEPTGGQVFAAGDTEALEAVFKHIDAMAQTKLEKTSSETMDDFRPWCFTGLGILGTWLLSLFGLRYTPW